MPVLNNKKILAVSEPSLRITPITILAGLRALVLRLRLETLRYRATGVLHFV